MISTDAFQTDTLSTLGSWLSAASNCLALADAALAARLSNTASLHVHLTTLIEKDPLASWKWTDKLRQSRVTQCT